MALDTDVQEAIDKNMSSQVGDRLKERLEQGKKDAEEVEALRKDTTELSRSRIVLLKEQEELERRLTEYHLREETIRKRENEIALMLERVKIYGSMMDTNRKDMMTILGTIFKGLDRPQDKELSFDLYGHLEGLSLIHI